MRTSATPPPRILIDLINLRPPPTSGFFLSSDLCEDLYGRNGFIKQFIFIPSHAPCVGCAVLGRNKIKEDGEEQEGRIGEQLNGYDVNINIFMSYD